MFNRGLTNKQRALKLSKSIQNKSKQIENDKEVSSSVPSSPVLPSISSSCTITPISSAPSSPLRNKSLLQNVQEPEPKIYKNEIDSIIKG